jgi:predicted nucleic acid-binding protein
MMLDTNALSAWAEGDSALLRVLPKDRLWHLPVVALGEFLFGVRRSRERAKLEFWIEEVKAGCVVAAIDAETAVFYADIREDGRATRQRAAARAVSFRWSTRLRAEVERPAFASNRTNFPALRAAKESPSRRRRRWGASCLSGIPSETRTSLPVTGWRSGRGSFSTPALSRLPCDGFQTGSLSQSVTRHPLRSRKPLCSALASLR